MIYLEFRRQNKAAGPLQMDPLEILSRNHEDLERFESRCEDTPSSRENVLPVAACFKSRRFMLTGFPHR